MGHNVNPSIYVDCLAAYNEGKAHGKWIALEDLGIEDLQKEIHLILKSSPSPNIFKRDYECNNCFHEWSISRSIFSPYSDMFKTDKCCKKCQSREISFGEEYKSSEEWAIHDYEDLTTALGECPVLNTVIELTALVVEHGELANGVYENASDIDESKQWLEEAYQGQYESLTDYAEQYCNDTEMLSGCSDHLKSYIDYTSMGRDFELSGDIFTIAVNGELHVFSSNY